MRLRQTVGIVAALLVWLTCAACKPGPPKPTPTPQPAHWSGFVTVDSAFTLVQNADETDREQLSWTLDFDANGGLSGNGSYQASIRTTDKSGCTTRNSANVSGAFKDPLQDIEPAFSDDGTYALSVPIPTIDGMAEFVLVNCGPVPAQTAPLSPPGQGFGLLATSVQGGVQVTGQPGRATDTHLDGHANVDLGTGVSVNVSWSLARQEDLEVVIDEPTDYATWMPVPASDATTPGAQLIINARVQNRDGTPATEPPQKWHFELASVSHQPGLSLNFPPATSAGSEADLQFVSGTVASDRTSTDVDGGDTSAIAVLGSFDGGGFGEVRVIAEMPDGRRLVGKVNGDDSRHTLLVPARDPGSRIARAFVAMAGGNGSDVDDSDAMPAGDGTPGDGLSLYEEYRGVHLGGKFTRLDPTTKDLFVRLDASNTDLPDVNAGLAAFQSGTQLAVHGELGAGELDGNHVINFNAGDATLVAQHGVLVTEDPSQTDGEVTIGPGPPGKCGIAQLPPLNPNDPHPGNGHLEHQLFTAHELGHCVGIQHHGDGNYDATWTNPSSGVYFEQKVDDKGQPYGSLYSISLDAGDLARLKFPVTVLQVGVSKGEQSGWDGCFMRYDSANAFVDMPGHRTLIPLQTASLGLGDATNGKSAALADATFGPAMRGNCAGQIHVSDR